MAIPENDETYLDRLLTSEQAAGLPHILNLDPDVNVRREDYRSLSDAYNYYLGGGRDATQADFPIQASGITAQGPIAPIMDSDRTAEIVAQQRAAGVPEEGLVTNFAPTLPGGYELPADQRMGAGISYEDDLVGVQPGFPMTDLDREALGTRLEGADITPVSRQLTAQPTVAGPLPYLQTDYQSPLDIEAATTPLESIDITPVSRQLTAQPTVAGPMDYLQPRYQSPLDQEALGTDLEGIGMPEVTSTTPLDLNLTEKSILASPALLAPLGGAAASQTMSDIKLINQMAKQYNLSPKNPATQQMLNRLKGAWVPNETFEKLGHGKGSTAKWLTSRVSPAHFGPVEAGIRAAKAAPGALLATAPLDIYAAGAAALQKSLEAKGLTGEGGIADVSGLDPMAAGADIDPRVDARLRDRTVNPFEETMAAEAVPTLEDIARASQYGTYMPEQAPTGIASVTGVEGPPSQISGPQVTGLGQTAVNRWGQEYDPVTQWEMSNEAIDAQLARQGPTMADVAGPVQNITLPSGDTFAADDPQLMEKVDPETKENTNMIAGLWERAKGNITDFKNSLQDAGNLSVQQIGSLVNAFTQGATTLNIAGALGIPGMIIGALAGAGTQVTPAQKTANAAFEQKHGITIGADGRINDPSGVLTGKVPAGKSFAGSATYEEMIDEKVGWFEDRIEKGKSYSKEKYQNALDLQAKEKGTFAPTDYEGEAYGTPDTITSIRDAEIDAGIAAADEEPGTQTPTVEDTAAMEDIGITSLEPEGDYDAYSDTRSGPTVNVSDIGGDTDPADVGTVATKSPHAPGGGGDPSGGGKIVCTMMNESYGFGSFRNKIWMKFHKNLTPEYQQGYHKLFLPLVSYAKQKGMLNKIIKKTLEHIAVHSTIDMRQSLRGKKHILGRIYRKIILPLCYWVGKYGKRT